MNEGLEHLLGKFGHTLDLLRRFLLLAEELEKPVKAHFVVITRRSPLTGEVITMPQTLVNDAISNIPVEFDNLAGQKVAPPPAGVIAVSAVDAAGTPVTFATVAVGADGSSVDVTPVPHDGTLIDPVATAFTVKLDDTSGTLDIAMSLDCNFGADPTAVSGHFDTTGITTRPAP